MRRFHPNNAWYLFAFKHLSFLASKIIRSFPIYRYRQSHLCSRTGNSGQNPEPPKVGPLGEALWAQYLAGLKKSCLIQWPYITRCLLSWRRKLHSTICINAHLPLLSTSVSGGGFICWPIKCFPKNGQRMVDDMSLRMNKTAHECILGDLHWSVIVLQIIHTQVFRGTALWGKTMNSTYVKVGSVQEGRYWSLFFTDIRMCRHQFPTYTYVHFTLSDVRLMQRKH